MVHYSIEGFFVVSGVSFTSFRLASDVRTTRNVQVSSSSEESSVSLILAYIIYIYATSQWRDLCLLESIDQ